MRILVTGAGGFVGQHLTQHLRMIYPDATLFGTLYRGKEDEDSQATSAGIQFIQVDLLEKAATQELLQETQPDRIFHLAGQASPGKSFGAAWNTLEVNIRAQLNLFEGCIELGLRPRFLLTSSAEIYAVTPPEIMPLTEDSPLRPRNPYGLSKLTQDMMGLQYALSHQFYTIRARPFNHIGPGQREGFVASDFAMQVARAEAHMQEPVLHVGNLSAERDFTDVRDVVRAYALLMEKGEPGEPYNVSSNRAYSIQYLLDTLLSLTKSPITVQVDESKLRPVDVPSIVGDSQKLRRLTGWQPEIPFEQTLAEVMAECRQRVHKQ